ncbi:BaiN/RdsA family NAD(P)/FAD-dependent oxidoreductase [Neolewinella litorea]|uniref:NAD(P)/FAD-dependent oxidoreductase n=1 Tax=Neolewinella litorea TaxID=2562452 RepID=A0A4S4NTZ6_9BACT|nr:NAD(P)/FAD-dependent oxidoreductase [Neolewinella litorea]THH39710.1 NAD(P)/FAD-dependent oxidoreductase [Neolewinella litorea]
MTTDTLIIGGGAAGFFAAIHRALHRPQERVVILERGRSILEKVRISGGGRCNVTHGCWDPRELVKFYPRGGRELLGPFHKFACGDTMAWFADRGVDLKIEDDGRVFPVSDDSQTIIDCLWGEARRLGIGVITGARAEAITAPAPRRPETDAADDRWTVVAGGQRYFARELVITSGSNPAVWKLLTELGHTVVDPVPSLFAFNIRDPRLEGLAGISLPWAQLHISGDNLKAEGPLLITHKGLSGPAVLRLSAWGARHLHPRRYDFPLSVNWVNQRAGDARAMLAELRNDRSRQQVGKRAQFDLPLRLWQSLVDAARIPQDLQWAQVSNAQLEALTRELTAGKYRVSGKATNKDEFTTAGGVDLREIDFRSFRSKKYPTLYLAGEVLDIDAITGGFNFQAAWTGGWLIGQQDPVTDAG